MTTPAPSTQPPVTVAITRRIDPQDEALMQTWADAGTALARSFEGYLGSGWVRPTLRSHEWHMLYRFADAESLARWESSRERQRWLRAGSDLAQETRVEHRTGIEGWFDSPTVHAAPAQPSDPIPPAPPRWKQMIVIASAFFPVSLLLTYLLSGLTTGWPIPLRVLMTTLVAIPLMTYVVLPQVTRLYQPWLSRSRPAAPR